MGLLDNFNLDDPKTMGLLSMAAQLAQSGGRSTRRISTGEGITGGLLAGMQGYQGAKDAAFQQQFRQAQMDEYKQKTASSKRKQDTLDRIRTSMAADPNYKPNMADLMELDTDSAIKSMFPKENAMEYGLQPKPGVNPSTQKTEFFVQGKDGQPKWTGIEVPPEYKYIAGGEYGAPQIFNPRAGALGPVNQTGASTPAGAAPAVTPAAELEDPNAPWSKLKSAKERDNMRARVYESDRKRLDELRQQVAQGDGVVRELERFGQLNREQETGGWLDKSPLPTTDAEKREMESIVARLAPSMRPAGSGTTSDKDIELYLKGLPGIDKTGDVNRNIRNQYVGAHQDAKRQLAFREDYLKEYGYLDGSFGAYKKALMPENGGQILGLQERAEVLKKITDPAERASFIKAVEDSFDGMGVDSEIAAGLKREWTKVAGQAAPKPAASSAFDNLPPAPKYKGKVARDQDTGKRYRSDGLRWVEVK